MDIRFFLIIFFLIVAFMVAIPLIVTFWLQNKYGNKLPGKIAVVFILGAIGYYGLFFTYAGDLVPESWKPRAEQVYQCEWKTVYVEKQP